MMLSAAPVTKKHSIRPVALAVILQPCGKLLLEQGYDSHKNEVFYRPLGGGVEFGETSAEAVAREIGEELNKNVQVESLLGVVENIFHYEGAPGHQIMFLHRCTFTDSEEYLCASFTRFDGNDSDTVCWKSPEEIRAEGARLYPVELETLLAA